MTENNLVNALLNRANLDDVEAQIELAARFASGDEIARELSAAFHWYSKAAANHSSEAMYNLALMYMLGESVDQDLVKAVWFLEEAARNGNSDANLVLAGAYASGQLKFSVDSAKSSLYYLNAMRLGSIKGIWGLGDLLFEGKISKEKLAEIMRNYSL